MTRISTHSLTSEVDIGSRLHDLVGEEFRILRMSSSDTGSTEDKTPLLLGLIVETGIGDCSATLIFSRKKCPKVLAKSATYLLSATTVE